MDNKTQLVDKIFIILRKKTWMAKRIDYNNNRVNLIFFYFKFALFLKC